MPSIQRRTGVIIIAVLVAVVVLISLPGKSLWVKVLQDTGHGPIFAGIAIVLALMCEPRTAGGARSLSVLVLCFLGAVLVGVGTELLQHFRPGRTVSSLDVFHDAAGAALGLAMLAIIERREPAPGVSPTSPATGRTGEGNWPFAYAVGLAALTALAWPPLDCAIAYGRRAANFPVLNDGSQRAGSYFIRAYHADINREPLPERFRQTGSDAGLRVHYSGGNQLRFEVLEPMPDWRSYGVLAIDLTNPAARPLKVTLRIVDAQHSWASNDRLNLPLVIAPQTRSTVRVALAAVATAPVGRRMDLSRIANLMLYANHPAPGSEFYVSRIWLE